MVPVVTRTVPETYYTLNKNFTLGSQSGFVHHMFLKWKWWMNFIIYKFIKCKNYQ